jgi:hypothetical protein
MADVASGHEEVIGADDGVFLDRGGAIYGDVFSEGVSVADAEAGGFAFIFEVLRSIADDGAGMKDVVGAGMSEAGEVSVRADAAAGAEEDAVVDDGERADFDIGGEFRTRMDDGGGVDHAFGR